MINKRSHPAVRRLREARAGRGPFLFVEGTRLVEELLKTPLRPRAAYFSASPDIGRELLPLLERNGVAGETLADDVMAFVSDLDSPPGLVVLAERPAPRWEESLKEASAPLAVVLDGVQSPSNAGAVVRAAEAAGATVVLQSKGGADLLGPKALRASAGSAFRLPLGDAKTSAEWLDRLTALGLRCVAADAKGETAHTALDWTAPIALFMGGERGLSAGLKSLPKVRVPLAAPVESLNVAVAAGVLLFEAARRRNCIENVIESTQRRRYS